MSMVAPPRPERSTRPARREREESEAPHLRVVPAPRRTGRRRAGLFVGFIAVFVILFGTVTFHVRLATGQQQIERLDRQAESAQARYDRLRLDVDRLSAPDRIVARARALGMVEAQDPTWLAPGSPAITGRGATSSDGLHDYLDVKPYLQDTK